MVACALWLLPACAFASEAATASVDPTASVVPTASIVPTASAEPTAPLLPFDFLAKPFRVRDIAYSRLPFFSSKRIPRVDKELHDSSGVRMFRRDGRIYNHVSRQAFYGIENLNTYRLTRDRFYLARARRQADRLIARRTEANGAWFHPYSFRWGSLKRPWYSALGQGYSLMLFCRLYEVTGEPKYKVAADKTFASFLTKGPSRKLWVVSVDAGHRMWLQEYTDKTAHATYNGHMVAVFGLYDYYRMTSDERALELLRGGLTTSMLAGPEYRQAGWRSLYSIRPRYTASPKYHEVIVRFYLEFFRLTGDVGFARLADTYEDDFAREIRPGRMAVRAGSYQAINYYSRKGGTMRVAKNTRLGVSHRRRILGKKGNWLRIASGPYRGRWIQERPGAVYYLGEAGRLNYAYARNLDVPRRGSYTLRRYAKDGTVTGTRALRFPSSPDPGTLRLKVRARAVVWGQPSVLIASGVHAGYWIPLRGTKLY